MTLHESTYKNAIGKHFDYSFNFEFLDVFADLLEKVIDNKKEDQEKDLFDCVADAINWGLIYYADQWKVIQFYQTPATANFSDACEELENDLYQVAEEVLSEEEE